MILRVDIVDNDVSLKDRLQDTFYLKDPDEEKLTQLKYMIETRFDNAPDNEIDWSVVCDFIHDNFETVDIKTFEIKW